MTSALSMISTMISQSPVKKGLYEKHHLEKSAQTNGAGCITCILSIALLIIGCVAAAGHLSGVVAGGCAVGLAVPLLLAMIVKSITTKEPCDRLVYMIQSIILIAITVLGSLAIAGIITPTTLGWVSISPTLITLAIAGCVVCCCGAGGCCCLGSFIAASTANGMGNRMVT